MAVPTPTNNAQVFAVVRTAVVILAVVAIVFGVIALIWPGVTITTIGVLFGIFLIISGAQRIARSIALRKAIGRWFLVGIVVGILVAIAGIVSISNPHGGVTFIAIVIGIGWILGGATDIVASTRSGQVSGWGIAGGAISLLAGFAFLFAPAVAASAFLTFAAILLIVVGVGVLLTFPRTMPGAVDGTPTALK
jgi:uncharacterized membrane protein HdeD (DUF308 family)